MLKRALKFSLIISILGIGILAGAMFLTKSVKKEVEKAEKTVPDQVEYISPKVVSEKKMSGKIRKKLKKKAGIFSPSYQKTAKSVIEKLKKADKYTLNNPLLIVNPYGTNKTGLYIYFKHGFRVNTKYTISIKSLDTENQMNIPDFSANMYTNTSNLPLAEQEGQLIGLLAGVKNYVSIYLYDENGTMVAKAGYKIELPSDEEKKVEKVTAKHEREISQLSEGLYAVFGLNRESENRSLPFYDNNGILRARLSLEKPIETKDVNLRFIDGKIFYAVNERKYILVNSVGRIEKFYSLEKGYRSFGDFDFTPANRYMLTFTKKNKENRDIISAIDLYDGKSWELIDLKKLLKGINRDFAFTSLRIINDNDIFVSEKNTSTIMRINNVFRRPEIKMILSNEESFHMAEFREKKFEKEGDFTSHFSQSAVFTDRGEKPVNRTYHLYVLNHGNSNNSEFYDYVINENNKTYTLVNTISLPYSAGRGGLNKVEDNFIFSLGEAGVFSEYNKENNVLATFKFNENPFEKVLKFDMKGCWFAK